MIRSVVGGLTKKAAKAVSGDGGNSLSRYWTPQKISSKVLFWGKISDIAGGQMPNKITGSTDFFTVAGSPYTFQCPNTAAYIAADTDYIWFKTDASQRTTTTAELIGYDLQRTPVKYLDVAPNTLEEIVILKAGEVLTATELNNLHAYMHLSMFWGGVENDYGYLKDNRTGQQLWTPEAVYEAESITYFNRLPNALTDAQKTAVDNLVKAAKANGWWTPAGVIRLLHNTTEANSLLNLKSTSFDATKVSTPVFTAYSGWVSNGTAKALNNNYIPSSAGNMTQNDAAFIEYYTGIPGTESNRFTGCSDGTRFLLFGHTTTTTVLGRINEAVGTNTTIATAVINGLWGIIRNGANAGFLRVVGASTKNTDIASASTGLPTTNIYSCGFNDNGSVNYSNSAKTTKATIIGKAISKTVFDLMKSDLETFFTAFTA